jgi:hypothetical protein
MFQIAKPNYLCQDAMGFFDTDQNETLSLPTCISLRGILRDEKVGGLSPFYFTGSFPKPCFLANAHSFFTSRKSSWNFLFWSSILTNCLANILAASLSLG